MDKENHNLNQEHQFGQFKRHTNKHHVYPTSRFILKKNPVMHTAWHDVFENSTPEEAIEKVKWWQSAPKEFKKDILDNKRRLRAWKMLFGKTELNKVPLIIQKDWTFPGFRMIRINN